MNYLQQLTIVILSHIGVNDSRYESLKVFHEVCTQSTLLLSKALKLPYKIITVDTGGELQENGTYTGAIGALHRDQADVAIVPLILSEDRMKVINFTYPVDVGSVSFASRKVVKEPEKASVLHPFHSCVWLVLLTSIIMMTLVLFVLFTRKKGYSFVLTITLAGVFRQSLSFKHRNGYEKALMFLWVSGLMFITSCYLSVLLSSLTLPQVIFVKDIKALSREVLYGKYRVMGRSTSPYPLMLLKSEDASTRVIGQAIYKNPRGKGNIDLFITLPDFNTAYADSRMFLNYLSDDFYISKDSFFFSLPAFAVGKNFCCKRVLDRAIHRMTAAGLYEKFIRDAQFPKTHYLRSIMHSTIKIPRPLTLLDVYGAFIALVSGLCFAIFIFFIELFLNKYCNIKRITRNGIHPTDIEL